MAHRRHELCDEEWEVLQSLVPPIETPGRYYRDHRTVLNAMLYRISTGVAWRDLPERYGPWETAYSRYRRWCRSGLWDCLPRQLQARLDEAGRVDWSLWCVDGSNVRAH